MNDYDNINNKIPGLRNNKQTPITFHTCMNVLRSLLITSRYNHTYLFE